MVEALAHDLEKASQGRFGDHAKAPVELLIKAGFGDEVKVLYKNPDILISSSAGFFNSNSSKKISSDSSSKNDSNQILIISNFSLTVTTRLHRFSRENMQYASQTCILHPVSDMVFYTKKGGVEGKKMKEHCA